MIESISSSIIKSKAARLQNFLKSQHSKMLQEIELEESFLSFLDAQLPLIKKLRDSFRVMRVSEQLSVDVNRANFETTSKKPHLQIDQDRSQPSRFMTFPKQSQATTPMTISSRPKEVPLMRLDMTKKSVPLAEQQPMTDGLRFEKRRLSVKANSMISSFCSNLKQRHAVNPQAKKPDLKHLGDFRASTGRLSFRASANHLAEPREAKPTRKSPKKFAGSPLNAPRPTPKSSRALLNLSKQSSGEIHITNMRDKQPIGFFRGAAALCGNLNHEIKEEAEFVQQTNEPMSSRLGDRASRVC